jgi:hypothetical protein
MDIVRISLLSFALGLLSVAGTPLRAQDTPPPTPPPQPPDSVDLVFEREVFVYPRYERRDPFMPLLDENQSGPRIEEIELKGIVFSSDPAMSVATFGLRSGQGGRRVSGQSFHVRRGEVLGNVRILEIQQTRVVVQIEEFGLTEQRVLELPRPGQGGL